MSKVFISHAEDHPELDDFVEELGNQVSVALGIPRKDAVFYDRERLASGDPWPAKLVEALQTSSAFVPIYSRAFFNSPWCGREWTFFRRRCDGLPQPAPDAPRVVPVLWSRKEDLPVPLPANLNDLQYSGGKYREEYEQDGLYFMMKLPKDSETQRLHIIREIANRVTAACRSPEPPRLPGQYRADDGAGQRRLAPGGRLPSLGARVPAQSAN